MRAKTSNNHTAAVAGARRPIPSPGIAVRTALLCVAALLLHGCGRYSVHQDYGPATPPKDIAEIPNAVPRPLPRSRYGNPSSYVVDGRRYYVLASARGYDKRGIASWYGYKFHGHRTSSGEVYDMYAMTAASRTLPLPTFVRVTNLENGRSVIVKVNDRGPFHRNRIIDLSYAAAAKLGILAKGTGLVEVRAITPGEPQPQPALQQAGATPYRAGLTPSAPPKVGLYLQVGAFRDLSNAEKLRTRLRQDNFHRVTIQKARSDNSVVYRVRLGPIPSADAADRLASRLDDEGLPTARVEID